MPLRLYITANGIPLLDRKMTRLQAKAGDMRPAWPGVTKAFREGFREWFETAGGGTWKPLTKKYEEWKAARYPFAPIMRRTDALFRSLAFDNQPGGIREEDETSLTLGSAVPYAGYANRQRTVIGLSERAKREITREVQRALIGGARDEGFQVIGPGGGGFTQTAIGEVG